MKNVAKMMGTVSMIAMVTACGAVEPQPGTYDVEVSMELSEDGTAVIPRVVILDSFGELVAEEETEALAVGHDIDVNEILKEIRIDVRVDGPPNLNPEPNPVKATKQTLVNDGWGNFSGQVIAKMPGEMLVELTISLAGEPAVDKANADIQRAVQAGMVIQREVEASDDMYKEEYQPNQN